MCTLNAREEIRYRNVDSMHIGVKILYDYERARDQGATQ